MTDEPLSRLDALELAVTQLADAVELLAGATASGRAHSHMDAVLEQVEHTRRLLGTSE